jgi:hypothetical protein
MVSLFGFWPCKGPRIRDWPLYIFISPVLQRGDFRYVLPFVRARPSTPR